MGLDYGERTVGVAISDPTGTVAAPRETLHRDAENKLRETLRRLEEIVREEEVGHVVLGLPLHLDGRMSPRGEKTLQFREKLERRLGLPVSLQDERLTSVEAEEVLRSRGLPRKAWKAQIDQIAAAFILQDYLNGQDCIPAGGG